MRNLILPIAAFLFLHATSAWAADLPDLPVDDRIKILTYNPGDVYRAVTKYGYQTSIVFARNEDINTVSVGDRSMWQIVPSGNRIFIRPLGDNLSTNMTVITNIREYNFDIVSGIEEDEDNLYVIQFRYPEKKNRLRDMYEQSLDDMETYPMRPAAPVALTPVAPATPPAMQVTTPVAIPPLDTQRTDIINRAYSYTGNDAFAPAEVYDDGRFTYVTYQYMPTPTPVPMLVTEEGSRVVASHSIRGNLMIVRTVASGFILKNPASEITVYNEQFHSR